MRVNLRIFFALLLTVWMTLPAVSLSAASGDAELYESAVGCREKLRAPAASSAKEADWLQCINKFKLVYIQNADTSLIDAVLLDIGGLYLDLHTRTEKKEHLQSALDSFRELYYYYPDSKSAPEATLRAGDIYLRQKQYARAYGAYSRILEYYSSSGQTEEARQRLQELAAYYKPPDAASAPKTQLPIVGDVRHWTNPRYTRLVISVDETVPYAKHILKNPDRIFIDLRGARLGSELIGRDLSINDGLLKRVRVGQYDAETVRVVLDIDHIERHKVFALENPFRLIVDVTGNGKGKGLPPADSGIKPEPGGDNAKLSLARQLGLGVETVVIDPGHGGKDPGAIGPGGVMEKDVVLDISKRLKEIIEGSTGRRAYLTRDDDTFLALEERTAIANTREADLFVSIHINAHANPAVRGMETYYLNLATTRAEQRIAARENRASYKKVSDLQKILSSLMLNSKKDESRALARSIQSALVKSDNGAYRPKDLGVKKAPFYVLIGAQMPSVLVEVSFVTNPREEKLLASPEYRQAMASRIYRGLEAYMQQMKSRPSVASQ